MPYGRFSRTYCYAICYGRKNNKQFGGDKLELKLYGGTSMKNKVQACVICIEVDTNEMIVNVSMDGQLIKSVNL